MMFHFADFHRLKKVGGMSSGNLTTRLKWNWFLSNKLNRLRLFPFFIYIGCIFCSPILVIEKIETNWDSTYKSVAVTIRNTGNCSSVPFQVKFLAIDEITRYHDKYCDSMESPYATSLSIHPGGSDRFGVDFISPYRPEKDCYKDVKAIRIIVDPENRVRQKYRTRDKIVFASQTQHPEGSSDIPAVSILPKGGKFNFPPEISILCPTQNAHIKYTTDGSLPSVNNGVEYTTPFKLLKGKTVIRSVAIANNMQNSEICTETFDVDSAIFKIEPLNVPNHSDLYETYRRGIITRHMCHDGFFANKVWLAERYDQDMESYFKTKKDPLATLCDPNNSFGRYDDYKQHIRSRFERSILNETLHENEAFCFIPFSGNNNKILSRNEENHLTNAGLLLATFSMEGLQGIDLKDNIHLSKYYADLLFDFIMRSESRHNGMLYRVHTGGDKTESLQYASTDDLVSVCVGLSYYIDFLWKCKDTTRLIQLKAFTKRIGKLLDDHGCFYLPPSNSIDSDRMSDIHIEFGHQLAFVFAYPLRLFFKKVADIDINVDWDLDEYRAYFPESHIFPDGWDEFLYGENVTNEDKWMWLADVVDKSGFHNEGMYEAFLSLYKNAVNGNFDHPIADVAAGFGAAVLIFMGNGLIGNQLVELTPIVGGGIATAISSNIDIQKKVLCGDNFFNFHITSLSTILAAKLERPYSEASSLMRTLLSTSIHGTDCNWPGRYNSLFAVIAAWNKPDEKENLEVQNALNFLAQGSDPADSPSMQHDLPILNCFSGTCTGWNLNPLGQSGNWRMFEQKNCEWDSQSCGSMDHREPEIIDSTVIKSLNARSEKTINGVAIKRGDHGSTAIVEASEVYWMFTNMLAMMYLNDPRFKIELKDKIQYSVLPYSGHIPPRAGLKILSKKLNSTNCCDSKYQEFDESFLPLEDVIKSKLTFIQTGDVNGDGRSDIIHGWSMEKELNICSKISNGDGTWVSKKQQIDDNKTYVHYLMRAGDINGDSKTDIVYTHYNDLPIRSKFEISTAISKGDGTWGYNIQVDTIGPHFGRNLFMGVGKINKDSYEDILYAFYYDSGNERGIKLLTKTSNRNGTWRSNEAKFPNEIRFVNNIFVDISDVNGDSLSDLVYVFFNDWVNKRDLTIRTKLSNGDGTWISKEEIFADDLPSNRNLSIALGDINGDQKADIVAVFSPISIFEKGFTIKTKMSNGDGMWISKEENYTDGYFFKNALLQIKDINKDSKGDIIYAAFNGWNSKATEKGFVIGTKISNGDGTYNSEYSKIPSEHIGNRGKILTGDMDRDSVPEFMSIYTF